MRQKGIHLRRAALAADVVASLGYCYGGGCICRDFT